MVVVWQRVRGAIFEGVGEDLHEWEQREAEEHHHLQDLRDLEGAVEALHHEWPG